MTHTALRAIALAILTLTFAAPAVAATTPRPMPTIRFSKVPLHTEFVVEVNKKGQVVRVRSGKSTSNYTYNAQTYGNVLQMWIRHPDGTAQVGVYRVTYDYNPSNHGIHRAVSMISKGGAWGDKQGAADQMMEQFRKNESKGAVRPNLPSLNSITGSTPKPSPTK